MDYRTIINQIVPDGEEYLFSGKRSFEKIGKKDDSGRIVSIDEMNNYLIKSIESILPMNEFNYLKSKKRFKRTLSIGTDEISFVSYDYIHYEFRIHFEKRIDEVQKIITDFRYKNGININPNYKDFSTVLEVYPEKDKIIASNYDNLRIQLAKLIEYIDKKYLPETSKLNHINELNRIYNKAENQGNLFTHLSRNKTYQYHLTGMILAKMSGDNNTYEDLLKEFSDTGNESTNELTRKLDDYLNQKTIANNGEQP